MRTYYIDADRRFLVDIENGNQHGEIVFDMISGNIQASKPSNMPKLVWIWHVMEFLKICAKMYKPCKVAFDVD